MQKTLKANGITRRAFVWSAAAGAAIAGTATPWRSVWAAPSKLRFVTFGAKNSIWAKSFFQFQKDVKEVTNGEMEVNWAGGPEVIHPFQAGEAVGKGVFDITHSANSYFAAAVPEAIALASGTGSVDSVRQSGALDALDKICQEKLNTVLFGTPLNGVGYIFLLREKPTSLEIFKGKKIRSIPLYDPILKALGAATVTTSPVEAYTSLERGVVDGLGWSDIGFIDYNFHDHAKFLMLPTFYHVRSAHLINADKFTKLGAEQQKALKEASLRTDKWSTGFHQAKRDSEHAAMKEKGLQEVWLPDADGKQFVELTERLLWDKINKDSPTNGPMLKKLFDKATAMG